MAKVDGFMGMVLSFVASPQGQEAVHQYLSSPEGQAALNSYLATPKGQQNAKILLGRMLDKLDLPTEVKESIRKALSQKK
ncbi:MAG: hypothetical protein ABR887_05670 [Methanoregulaceae archaeon]|jgi:hypothetical protein